MIRSKVVLLSTLTAFAAIALAAAPPAGKPAESSKPANPPAQHAGAPANPGFEMLKKLAGTWTGAGGEMGDVTVTYKVISAGSTVMETIMPGTDHEMVTMYHMDGNDLVLTHYCALGNQPHMKAEALKREAGQPATLKFTCVGGSNMKSEKDMHMHSAEFTFVDDDHLQSTWGLLSDGKEVEHAKFDMHRKK